MESCAVNINYPLGFRDVFVPSVIATGTNALLFNGTLTDPLGNGYPSGQIKFNLVGVVFSTTSPLTGITDSHGLALLHGTPSAPGLVTLFVSYQAFHLAGGNLATTVRSFHVADNIYDLQMMCPSSVSAGVQTEIPVGRIFNQGTVAQLGVAVNVTVIEGSSITVFHKTTGLLGTFSIIYTAASSLSSIQIVVDYPTDSSASGTATKNCFIFVS